MPAFLDNLASRLRVAWARAHGVTVGPGARWGGGIRVARGFRDGKNGRVAIGARSWFSEGAVLDAFGGEIALGCDVHIGPHTVLYGQGGLEIGDETLVGPRCTLLSSEHTIPAPGRAIRGERDRLLPTRIGADVLLGAGVIVLGGVSIGDGCVVGAGSVVTRDLPPASVAYGVPARVHSQRSPASPQ